MADKGKVYYSPAGDKIRKEYLWNADKTALELVAEHDIQKEINERAKGMTIAEQIVRMERGDFSLAPSGEGFYGDVSDVPESGIEQINLSNAQLDILAKKVAEQEAAKKDELNQAKEALEKANAELAALKGEKENA